MMTPETAHLALLPTPKLYYRYTQPTSCVFTDASEAAGHDGDLRWAGKGCGGSGGVSDGPK